ncbi:MAG: uridylate kinase [Desulfurococcaceae archaeon]|nr:uridylate kinase [Desulfurococcaceae archaeon]
MQVVFVKAGGSFITHKDVPVKVNVRALNSLVKILRAVKDDVSLVLGNGGGAFAHYAVLKHKANRLQVFLSKCHQATRSLNRLIVDYLVESGIWATSVQTSSIICKNKGEFKVFIEPIKQLVSNNIIPVVYGECILSGEDAAILSTEKVFEILSMHIRPSRIVLLTDVNGVFTCNPRTCSNAKLITRITPENLHSVLEVLKGTTTSDATGGIYSKVLSMSAFSFKTGIEVIITSGFDEESAVAAIKGLTPKYGTIISPRP